MAATPLTIAEFKVRRPEFEDAPDTLIQAKLDEAWRRTARDADEAQDIHSIQAARLLARAPMGMDAKIVSTLLTQYDQEWAALRDELGAALSPRVAGIGPGGTPCL